MLRKFPAEFCRSFIEFLRVTGNFYLSVVILPLVEEALRPALFPGNPGTPCLAPNPFVLSILVTGGDFGLEGGGEAEVGVLIAYPKPVGKGVTVVEHHDAPYGVGKSVGAGEVANGAGGQSWHVFPPPTVYLNVTDYFRYFLVFIQWRLYEQI
jgi:hypothetical protein